jgi:hypothetical protein
MVCVHLEWFILRVYTSSCWPRLFGKKKVSEDIK